MKLAGLQEVIDSLKEDIFSEKESQTIKDEVISEYKVSLFKTSEESKLISLKVISNFQHIFNFHSF